MGVPLLEDVLHSMEYAIKAREEKLPLGSYEKARLMFAHAETIVPFSCLFGFFLDGSEFENIQKEQPLELPPQPPKSRDFRGSTMAPFGGNNILVLYSCPADVSPKYFVQVLHNEHPIAVPGCNGKDFCSLEDFKKVVTPHLKHAFDYLCNANLDNLKQKPVSSRLSILSSWFFGWSQDSELTSLTCSYILAYYCSNMKSHRAMLFVFVLLP